MAAPAETGTPNMHRAKQSLIEECGRKGGDSGDAARKKQHDQQRPKRIHLTLTGLLMEGDYTLGPFTSAIRTEILSISMRRSRVNSERWE
jgi:hypothetical protein